MHTKFLMFVTEEMYLPLFPIWVKSLKSYNSTPAITLSHNCLHRYMQEPKCSYAEIKCNGI